MRSPDVRSPRRARPLSAGVRTALVGAILGLTAFPTGCQESIPPYALVGDASAAAMEAAAPADVASDARKSDAREDAGDDAATTDAGADDASDRSDGD